MSWTACPTRGANQCGLSCWRYWVQMDANLRGLKVWKCAPLLSGWKCAPLLPGNWWNLEGLLYFVWGKVDEHWDLGVSLNWGWEVFFMYLFYRSILPPSTKILDFGSSIPGKTFGYHLWAARIVAGLDAKFWEHRSKHSRLPGPSGWGQWDGHL